MHPETRFATTLVTSLVLWVPTCVALLHGDVDLPNAMLRYLFALVVAWLAITAFNALLWMYHRQNAVAGAERDAEALAARLAQLDTDRIDTDGADHPGGTPE